MSTATYTWTWSQPHQDYYYVTYDEYSRPLYHWSRQEQVASEQVLVPVQASLPRQDLVYQQDNGSNTAQMPDPAPYDVRTGDFIAGTPQTGWFDLLDESYRMRTGYEARQFFVVGKVFAMLYTEAASGMATVRPNDDAYTVVRFNETVHTNIRRFIVVEVRRGFVKACGIGTYSGRGTLKEGCNPSEHAVVYLTGTNARSCYLPGELQWMTKEPIEIEPVDSSIAIRTESRIRFGKTYPIEMNVKVKDIGRVQQRHLSKLLKYWNDEEQVQNDLRPEYPQHVVQAPVQISPPYC